MVTGEGKGYALNGVSFSTGPREVAENTDYPDFSATLRGGCRLTQRRPLVWGGTASAKASVNFEVNPGHCSWAGRDSWAGLAHYLGKLA
jgi:hypothetical protein